MKYFIPQMHLVMIMSTVGLIVLFSILYHVTEDKEKLVSYSALVTTLIGFMIGKLTNMFGQPMVQKHPEYETEEETADRERRESEPIMGFKKEE